jgi:hypothetical protein
MTLDHFLKELALGNLRSVASMDGGIGEFSEDRKIEIVAQINAGLLRLCSDMPLKTDEVLIAPVLGRSMYPLESRYALSAVGSAEDRFIIDSPSRPFQDNVLKILQVFGEDGREIPMNIDGVSPVVFTPTPTSLQIASFDDGFKLSAICQIEHGALSHELLEDEIDIPRVLHPALKEFVAWKVFGGMAGEENKNKARSHFRGFEDCLERVSTKDLTNMSAVAEISKFTARGFR